MNLELGEELAEKRENVRHVASQSESLDDRGVAILDVTAFTERLLRTGHNLLVDENRLRLTDELQEGFLDEHGEEHFNLLRDEETIRLGHAGASLEHQRSFAKLRQPARQRRVLAQKRLQKGLVVKRPVDMHRKREEEILSARQFPLFLRQQRVLGVRHERTKLPNKLHTRRLKARRRQHILPVPDASFLSLFHVGEFEIPFHAIPTFQRVVVKQAPNHPNHIRHLRPLSRFHEFKRRILQEIQPNRDVRRVLYPNRVRRHRVFLTRRRR